MPDPLPQQMSAPEKHDEVADDATRLLESEVRASSGMSGLAIKAGFKVLAGLRPGFVRHAVGRMLDDFLEALDPFYQEAVAAGRRPGAVVEERPDPVSDALLKVADRKVERSKNEIVKKTYGKLRPSAQKHVGRAAPRIGALLDRHAVPS